MNRNEQIRFSEASIKAAQLASEGNHEVFRGNNSKAIELYSSSINTCSETVLAYVGRSFANLLRFAETPILEHKDLTQLVVEDLKNALHNAEEMLNEM